jgi:hypothetical protein
VRPCSTARLLKLYEPGEPPRACTTGGEQLADCSAQALERFGVGHSLEDRTAAIGRTDRFADAFVAKREIIDVLNKRLGLSHSALLSGLQVNMRASLQDRGYLIV